MKSLTQTINEKLKIHKSKQKQWTFEFRRQFPVSHPMLLELVDKLYGIDAKTITISKGKTSQFHSEVTCNSDDDVIKILVLIYLLWNPMFNNYPSKQQIDSNYLEYYIKDTAIRDFADKNINDIESMVEELSDKFNKIYDDVRKKHVRKKR